MPFLQALASPGGNSMDAVTVQQVVEHTVLTSEGLGPYRASCLLPKAVVAQVDWTLSPSAN